MPQGGPSNDLNFNELIATWLNTDTGDAVSLPDNTLTLLFADPTQTDTTNRFSYDQNLSSVFGHVDSEWPALMPVASTSRSTMNCQNGFSHPPASSNPIANEQYPNGRSRRPLEPTGLTADTWESGISPSDRPDNILPWRLGRSVPSRNTSPRQVVVELEVRDEDEVREVQLLFGLWKLKQKSSQAPGCRSRDGVIPSMKFLDSCLQLYFREFHPCFPIIHKPTFRRDRTPPILSLSMRSIGCMFVGTQAARETGIWIYERLHYVIVNTVSPTTVLL